MSSAATRPRPRTSPQRHGAASAYDDYRALLEDPAVDAVYIATPNALHADQVVAAAEAGKHVLCDKPLATTVADAERAVAACEAAGVRLGITFQTRKHQGMSDLRQLVADGEIGSVRLAQVEVGVGRMLPQGWRTDPALAGVGVMNNMGVHAYDLLRYLLGAEVTEATAVVDVEEGWDVDTMALALLRFDNGALAYVNANQSVPNSQSDLSIYGTEGTVLGRGITRPNLSGQLLGDRAQRHHRARGLHGRALRRDGRRLRRRGAAGARPQPLAASTASGACSSPTPWRARCGSGGRSGWTAEPRRLPSGARATPRPAPRGCRPRPVRSGDAVARAASRGDDRQQQVRGVPPPPVCSVTVPPKISAGRSVGSSWRNAPEPFMTNQPTLIGSPP